MSVSVTTPACDQRKMIGERLLACRRPINQQQSTLVSGLWTRLPRDLFHLEDTDSKLHEAF